jgi:signal transduction histidine kinase
MAIAGLCTAAAVLARSVLTSGGLDLGSDEFLAYVFFIFVGAAVAFSLASLWRRRPERLPLAAVGSWPRSWSSPTVAGAILCAGLAALALLVYLLVHQSVERSVRARLQAVGTFKASLAKAWIDDSRDDIRIWTSSPEFIQLIEEWRSHGSDVEAKARLIARLREHARTSQYVELGLRDPATGALLLTTGTEDDSPAVRGAAMAAAAAAHPMLDPLPEASKDGAGRALEVGFLGTVRLAGPREFVVHVGIDPDHELYPMIELWPGDASTAEVLLLRHDGSSLAVLNDTAVTKAGQIARQLDDASPHSIGAALIAHGAGPLQGVDDRGHHVLAFASAVEGTNWLVVAKLDRAAAFAELDRIALLAVSLGTALLLVTAWWWRDQRRQAHAEQLREHERAEQAVELANLSRRVVSAQEDERRRLASELHDRTGANLATIDINLSAITKHRLDRGPDHDALLRETRDLLADTIASIRDFCGELRPAALDYAGLAPAIEHHLHVFTRRTGIAAALDHSGYCTRCAAPVEAVLFRIFQEAVLNCAKHSRATRVDVTLSSAAGRVSLTIADNGVGFAVEQLGQAGPATGSGLLGMRERAALAGGALVLDSAPCRGTRVAVQLESAEGAA